MVNLFSRRKPRLLVLGLDCAAPELIFDEFHADLPTLRQLMSTGTYGILESSVPCITVPAWASMLSSRDPGVLGIYGFRNRADTGYDALITADRRSLNVKRIWDHLGEAGKPCLVMNVPQTYPVTPINGHLVSCFLTPGRESAFAYPAIFKQEVLKLAPEYPFDIADFRTPDKADLLRRLQDFTDIQYTVLEHALMTKDWDFAMHVNMGIDRVHHGFWRYHDPQHRLHEPHPAYQTAIRDYYKQVDAWLGRILNRVGDAVTVLVVSDHGVKRMDGAIAINAWLWREGWLSFKTPPPTGSISKFDVNNVDWTRTKAWSTGGYYGRIFMNRQGREPQGIIADADYPRIRAELAAQLKAIPGANGEALNTHVFFPEAIYQQVNGVAPDMIVYFGDLHWRAAGTLGYEQHFTLENDTGPDDANHSPEGMFILYEPGRTGSGSIARQQLMNIAPTILDRFKLPIPKDLQGQVIQ